MPLCNGADRGCNIIRRESGQTSVWSFLTREFDNRLRRESRWRQSLDNLLVRSPRQRRMARHRLAESLRERASAPSAYREGNAGR